MSEIAIRAENLGKMYRIGAPQRSYPTLRDAIVRAVTSPWERAWRLLRGEATGAAGLREILWALRGLDFEVNRGEVIGVIGRNGAGKSTLLKVLTQITEPTEGRAEIHGRVGSLLEVGTGFHPELTGRENIFLNGAILGMRNNEVRDKFDAIVEFAEIERFVDTPVKHYSSGMYTRLAFAVAAHLDTEVLLVDEVLAVGDIAFQQKCLGKMHDVTESEGRTVVFVSHNMATIQSLCNRVLLLRGGRRVAMGPTKEVVGAYMMEQEKAAETPINERTDREGTGEIRLTDVTVTNLDPNSPTAIYCGAPVRFDLHYRKTGRLANNSFHVGVHDIYGVHVVHFSSRVTGCHFDDLRDSGVVSCTVPRLPLPQGRYKLEVAVLGEHRVIDRLYDAVILDVQVADFYGSGDMSAQNYAKVLVDHTWEHRQDA